MTPTTPMTPSAQRPQPTQAPEPPGPLELTSAPLCVQLDGRPCRLPAGSDLAALLQVAGLAPEAVGTALNGRFVARAARAGCRLAEGDAVTTFRAIVGG